MSAPHAIVRRAVMAPDQEYGADVSFAGQGVVDLHRVHEMDGSFTPEHIALIKRAFASENLTDDEFQVFLWTAQRQGLDPLAKQIYAVKRKGKLVLQTSIDGYRLKAVRTREYCGNDDPTYLPADESTPQPIKATVTVYRRVDGEKVPFTASARWKEYAPADLNDAAAFMWKKMPYLMLGKVAEALALRKAFPSELAECHWQPELDVRPTNLRPELRPTGPARNVAQDVRIVDLGDGLWRAEGNTRPAKDLLKGFGFKWTGEAWETTDAKAAAKAKERFEPPTGGFDEMPRSLRDED